MPIVTKAFLLRLRRGCAARYRRLHNPLPDDMRRLLRRHHISRYSIFLEPATGQLFCHVEIASHRDWEAMLRTSIARRWRRRMRRVLVTMSDDRPRSVPLEEVFRLGSRTPTAPPPRGRV